MELKEALRLRAVVPNSKNLLAVPLKDGSQTYGVVVLGKREGSTFSKRERASINSVRESITNELRKAQLFDESVILNRPSVVAEPLSEAQEAQTRSYTSPQVQTKISGLHLFPSGSDLAGAEVELAVLDGRENALKNVVSQVLDQYDFIILDCPPALGLLTVNALAAAHSVLIPVQCEYYAMEGLGRLIQNIDRVRNSFNPELELEGILLTMWDYWEIHNNSPLLWDFKKDTQMFLKRMTALY